MKILYVFRHAKSSWKDPELPDIDRPLLEKGRKKTHEVVKYLLRKNATLDGILSSPAVRAYETALLLADGLDINRQKIQIDNTLYDSDADQIYDCLFQLPDSMQKVAVVGHNPAVTNFANNYLDSKIDALPTSGVIAIKFDTNDWTRVFTCKWKLLFITWPAEL